MSPACIRGGALALAALLSSATGSARAEDPGRRIDVIGFAPTPGRGLVVDDATPLGHLVIRASLLVDWASNLLEASGSNRPEYVAVERMVTGHVTFAFGLWDRVELGADMPVVSDMAGSAGVGARGPLSGLAPGDLRIVPKVRLAGGDLGANLALVAGLSVPTGKDDANAGERGATFSPELAFSYRFGPGTAIGVNAGYRLRPAVSFGRLLVDDEVTFSAGFSARIAGVFGITGECFGAIGVSEDTDDPDRPVDWAERPIEADGAFTFDFDNGMQVVLGGGAGLTHGYGAPAWRAFLGFGGTFDTKPPPDLDGDGVMDPDDRCVSEPEDDDGFEDGDGCPDPDNDRDGLGDGDDACPNDAEDKDGFEDGDGCPDPDNDGDGVVDGLDRCPDISEDRDGFQDDDGCPDPDNDGDGVLDRDDKCPLEAEVKNGVDDLDGCPDEAEIQINRGKIEFKEPILFAFSRAVIDERSSALLDRIADLIKANPQLTKVRIEGHTDLQGIAVFNKKLSEARAEAVLEALVARGLARERFVAEGFGQDRPLCKENTPACDAKNRRTELVLVEIDGKPVE